MRTVPAGAIVGLLLLTLCLGLACSGQVGPEPSPQGPVAIISIDSVVASPDGIVEVPVRVSFPPEAAQRLDTIGEFRLVIQFDNTLLDYVDSAKSGEALLGWDYFSARATYLQCSTCPPAVVNISAQNRSRRYDTTVVPQPLPEGVLTKLYFHVKPGYNSIGGVAELSFLARSCLDNSLSRINDRYAVYVADTTFSGCDPNAVIDTMICERLIRFTPTLSFHRGAVSVHASGGGTKPGDLNADGVAFDTRDINAFFDHFPYPPSAPRTRQDSLWLFAGDCNRDGQAFTLADYDFLFRVAFEGLPSSDTLRLPQADTQYIAFQTKGDTLTLYSKSSSPVSMFWIELLGEWETGVDVTWLGSAHASLLKDQSGDTLRLLMLRTDPNHQFVLDSERTAALQIVSNGVQSYHVRARQASAVPGVVMVVKEVLPPPAIFTFSMPTIGGVVVGDQVSVPITLTYENGIPERGIGGLDLLVQYDPEALSLRSVDRGAALRDWEYTTHRFAGTGLERFVGIVDMNDGHTPNPSTFESVGEYAVLHFEVIAEVPPMGMATPLQFILRDCGDNVLSSKDGTTVFLPDLTRGNPVVDGTYDPDACIEGKPGYEAAQSIELINGSVRIFGSP